MPSHEPAPLTHDLKVSKGAPQGEQPWTTCRDSQRCLLSVARCPDWLHCSAGANCVHMTHVWQSTLSTCKPPTVAAMRAPHSSPASPLPAEPTRKLPANKTAWQQVPETQALPPDVNLYSPVARALPLSWILFSRPQPHAMLPPLQLFISPPLHLPVALSPLSSSALAAFHCSHWKAVSPACVGWKAWPGCCERYASSYVLFSDRTGRCFQAPSSPTCFDCVM